MNIYASQIYVTELYFILRKCSSTIAYKSFKILPIKTGSICVGCVLVNVLPQSPYNIKPDMLQRSQSCSLSILLPLWKGIALGCINNLLSKMRATGLSTLINNQSIIQMPERPLSGSCHHSDPTHIISLFQ
ncbi:hypothetical protein H5410_029641 [Solanum commersonii]|uniref:Uncharacterized protein n=1 Tax=Solanum commersonii TaxID=4109 RepID=A0A9J5YEK1_SOLCO|nr:hypothetical protein H5410_029641 [Solanum commersonii]